MDKKSMRYEGINLSYRNQKMERKRCGCNVCCCGTVAAILRHDFPEEFPHHEVIPRKFIKPYTKPRTFTFVRGSI